MKKLLLFLFLPFWAQAQTPADAFRYSNTGVIGTARMLGAGGTLGPLGGDFGAITDNPASLAAFRRSEWSMTPGVAHSSVTSSIKDNPGYSNATAKLTLNSSGFVFANKPNEKMGLVASNWALGWNRVADFNQSFFYQAVSEGTIVERFGELANGVDPGQLDPFEAKLAFSTNAIYTPNAQGIYQYDGQLAPYAMIQREGKVNRSGSTNEFFLAYAASLNHNLGIGFSIGAPWVRYRETKDYRESDPNDEVPYFTSLNWKETLKANGIGLNIKLGLNYRFSQALRGGLSLHSPTWYSLSEDFNTELDYDYVDGSTTGPFTAVSPVGSFTYSLQTPWKYNASLGYVIDKSGFITMEIESQNYGKSRFNFKDGSLDDLIYQEQLNQDVDRQYRQAYVLKLGGEKAWRMLRLRLGGGLQTSPLTDDSSIGRYFTAGFGLRFDNSYIDFGAMNTRYTEGFTPYRLGTVPARMQTVNNKGSKTLVQVTFGFKL
jgi:hypothetical protein